MAQLHTFKVPSFIRWLMAQNGGYMITLVTTTLESEPVWNIEAPGLRLLCHQSKLSLQSSISLTNPACPWTFLSLISNLRLEITDIEYKEHTEYFRLQDWAFLWLAKPCTQMILSHLLKHSLDKWYRILNDKNLSICPSHDLISSCWCCFWIRNTIIRHTKP